MLISKSLVSKAQRDLEPLPGAPCEQRAAVFAANGASLDSLECWPTRSSGNAVQGLWVLNKGQEPKGCHSGTSGYQDEESIVLLAVVCCSFCSGAD